MSEKKYDTLQMQREIKPNPENVVAERFDGDKLNIFLDFIGFLKSNKLTPRWSANNSWVVKHKNKTVCHIMMREKESWNISLCHFTREKWFKDYEKYLTDDLKEFVVDNISGRRCPGRDCSGKESMAILGKEFEEVCRCWPIQIKNPDGSALACSKKLILVIKTIITDLAVASKV